MMKSFLSMAIFVFACISGATGQNEIDALRYSYTDFPGSARSLAMGGAFGALGADMSSFWLNPAGIGLYKRKEISLGLGVNETGSSADYMGQEAANSAGSFRLKNFGLVGAQAFPEGSEWKSIGYGVGYTRTRDYNQDISIQGDVMNTSLLDVFCNQAAGVLPDVVTEAYPFGAGLAYQCYLIDPTDSTGSSYIPVVSGPSTQQKYIRRRGSMSETTFGLGANYSDIVYLGFSMGIQAVSFDEQSTYSESGFEPSESLDRFNYVEQLSTNGVGITFRGGAIVRASEWLRVGASAQSPGYLALHDAYSTSMQSNFVDGSSYDWSSPAATFNYNLRTPWRFSAQSAFILGKDGLISADYEFEHFGQARLSNAASGIDAYDFSAENTAIRTIYRSTHSVRAGFEWRILQVWRVRGGASYRQSPFNQQEAVNTPEIAFTGGVGYRKDQFFVELAFISAVRDETHYLYDPAMVQPAEIRHSIFQSVLNIGIRY